jgi:16S rRNA (uracil1498-N3)-methyltransferase
MSIQRFFLPHGNIRAGQVDLPATVQHQIKHVLRLKAGEQVLVLDSRSLEYLLRLEQTPEGVFYGIVLETRENTAEPAVRLTLYLALTQREKFEWVLQKGTETGVAAFQPVICRRSLVQADNSFEKKRARWEKILQEAAEQSGRGRVPDLADPLDLSAAVERSVNTHALSLAAWEHEDKADLQTALRGFPADGSLGLFIGPEGGFDDSEMEHMGRLGVRTFSLGPRILRMETAAILAPALVLYQLGQMEVRQS